MERTLEGPSRELEIDALKIELETAVSLQKKLEIVVSPILGLFRVELVRDEDEKKTRLKSEDARTVTSELIETIEEKLKILLSTFEERWNE